jgi:predicted nuclease of predicted toxin-antitoxin system
LSGLRLLLDMNLPPSLCGALKESGYPAIHVRDLGWQAATDEALVLIARQRGEVIVTNDLDFTRILAVDGATNPSLLLFRVGNLAPSQFAVLLQQHLYRVKDDLLRGAIVVIEHRAVRIRPLPVGDF